MVNAIIDFSVHNEADCDARLSECIEKLDSVLSSVEIACYPVSIYEVGHSSTGGWVEMLRLFSLSFRNWSRSMWFFQLPAAAWKASMSAPDGGLSSRRLRLGAGRTNARI